MRKAMSVVSAALLAVTVGSGVAVADSGARSVSHQDRTWLRTTAAGDMTEIQGGMLAQTHARSATVKSFGTRLVIDHSRSLRNTRALAARLGVTLPTRLDAQTRSELARLSALRGRTFDRIFTQVVGINDHKIAISGTQREISHGSNPRVITMARLDLPVLQTHLRLAERAHARVTAPRGQAG